MSSWFNILGRIILVLQFVPVIWTQPLINEEAPAVPTPFYHMEPPGQGEDPMPSAAPPPEHMMHEMAMAMASRHNPMAMMMERRPSRLRGVGSLCSLFRTFLDARTVNCRVSLPNHDRDEEESSSADLDTNALVQIQSDSMSRGSSMREMSQGHMPSNDRMDRLGSEEDNDEEEDSIDHHHHHLSNHRHGIDPTRILQDKTTIVVPEPRCPHGQRRDPRGYCRTVLRIRPYYGPGHGGHGQPVSVRPIKYYYRRFVAVPTLHFILPH